MKSSSRYILAHTLLTSLSTSSSNSGPKLSVFLRILCEIELSLQSRAHFVDLISKKCKKSRQCNFHVKSSSRYSCAHFVNHFPDRGARPRKGRPSSCDRGQPLYPKKTKGFAPESVFSREFTLSRSLTLPNYLMMM